MREHKPTELEIPAFSIYGEAEDKPALRFLNVEDLAATNRLHNWNIRAHRHRALFQLFHIRQGQCEAVIDDVAVRICAPALLAIPPQVVHGFRFEPDSTGTILSIAEPFRQDLLRLTGDIFVFENIRAAIIRELSVADDSTVTIAQTFRDIVTEMEDARPGRTTAIAAKILDIFAILARLNVVPAADRPDIPGGDTSLFHAFCELVESNFDKSWAIQDYAHVLHTTERTLRRTLARIAGESPLDIIHRRKFTEAKRRLVYTDDTIGQIAYRLGFSDSSHFNKFFVKRARMTPVLFRRKEQRSALQLRATA